MLFYTPWVNQPKLKIKRPPLDDGQLWHGGWGRDEALAHEASVACVRVVSHTIRGPFSVIRVIRGDLARDPVRDPSFFTRDPWLSYIKERQIYCFLFEPKKILLTLSPV